MRSLYTVILIFILWGCMSSSLSSDYTTEDLAGIYYLPAPFKGGLSEMTLSLDSSGSFVMQVRSTLSPHSWRPKGEGHWNICKNRIVLDFDNNPTLEEFNNNLDGFDFLFTLFICGSQELKINNQQKLYIDSTSFYVVRPTPNIDKYSIIKDWNFDNVRLKKATDSDHDYMRVWPRSIKGDVVDGHESQLFYSDSIRRLAKEIVLPSDSSLMRCSWDFSNNVILTTGGKTLVAIKSDSIMEEFENRYIRFVISNDSVFYCNEQFNNTTIALSNPFLTMVLPPYFHDSRKKYSILDSVQYVNNTNHSLCTASEYGSMIMTMRDNPGQLIIADGDTIKNVWLTRIERYLPSGPSNTDLLIPESHLIEYRWYTDVSPLPVAIGISHRVTDKDKHLNPIIEILYLPDSDEVTRINNEIISRSEAMYKNSLKSFFSKIRTLKYPGKISVFFPNPYPGKSVPVSITIMDERGHSLWNRVFNCSKNTWVDIPVDDMKSSMLMITTEDSPQCEYKESLDRH